MPRDDVKGPKWDIDTEIPDLTGKVALVTGANSSSGIGFNIVYYLAINGARVYVGARSAAKANDAIAELKKRSPGKALDLKPFVADLCDFKQVQAAAQVFVKEETRLDILVHNAGLLARPLDKDANGISVSMVANHFGPFLLNLELYPLLVKTAKAHPGVRVVSLSSSVHSFLQPGIKFSSLEDFNAELGGTSDFNSNLQRYGLSKLANILFAKELQRKFDREGVEAISISLHPGGVKTVGAINFLGGDPDHAAFADAMTPLEGAITPLFAATRPEIWAERGKYAGAFLYPYGVLEEPTATAKDEVLAKEMWVTSETIVRGVLAN